MILQIESGNIIRNMKLSTILRKKHNGIWYLWHFYKQLEFIPNETFAKDRDMTISLFHTEVYNVLMRGKIDPKAMSIYGAKMFTEDPSQISEEERLESFDLKPVIK